MRTSPESIRERLGRLTSADPRSQAEIARTAEVNPGYFSQILTGHRDNPSIGTVAKILAALGKRWRDLD